MALLAVLMLFIAPEVSKTLEHQRMADNMAMADEHSGAAPAMGMAMDEMAMDGHAAHQSSPATVAGEASGHHDGGNYHPPAMNDDMGNMDDFACGYCLLLVHLPWLLWIAVPLAWLMLFASGTPPPLNIPPYHFTFFPGLSQPRAPPAL